MPAGRNSSGLWPAEASRPIAPETCESTIQKSPCGVDSTRGARSRSRAGARDVHRSFGAVTCAPWIAAVHGVQAAGHGVEARQRVVLADGGETAGVGADAAVLGAEAAVVACLLRAALIAAMGLAPGVEAAHPPEVGLPVVAVERRARDAHARR